MRYIIILARANSVAGPQRQLTDGVTVDFSVDMAHSSLVGSSIDLDDPAAAVDTVKGLLNDRTEISNNEVNNPSGIVQMLVDEAATEQDTDFPVTSVDVVGDDDIEEGSPGECGLWDGCKDDFRMGACCPQEDGEFKECCGVPTAAPTTATAPTSTRRPSTAPTESPTQPAGKKATSTILISVMAGSLGLACCFFVGMSVCNKRSRKNKAKLQQEHDVWDRNLPTPSTTGGHAHTAVGRSAEMWGSVRKQSVQRSHMNAFVRSMKGARTDSRVGRLEAQRVSNMFASRRPDGSDVSRPSHSALYAASRMLKSARKSRSRMRRTRGPSSARRGGAAGRVPSGSFPSVRGQSLMHGGHEFDDDFDDYQQRGQSQRRSYGDYEGGGYGDSGHAASFQNHADFGAHGYGAAAGATAMGDSFARQASGGGGGSRLSMLSGGGGDGFGGGGGGGSRYGSAVGRTRSGRRHSVVAEDIQAAEESAYLRELERQEAERAKIEMMVRSKRGGGGGGGSRKGNRGSSRRSTRMPGQQVEITSTQGSASSRAAEFRQAISHRSQSRTVRKGQSARGRRGSSVGREVTRLGAIDEGAAASGGGSRLDGRRGSTFTTLKNQEHAAFSSLQAARAAEQESQRRSLVARMNASKKKRESYKKGKKHKAKKETLSQVQRRKRAHNARAKGKGKHKKKKKHKG